MLEVKVKRALQGFKLDVDFSIDKEILAILGPSGSGKTMTLMSIAGLIRPDEGFIALNGRVLFDSAKGVNLSPQKRRVGFVFQNYALFPHLTVNQNIAYGISNLSRQETAARVAGLLEKMNIQALGNRLPRQLSSGQQQRVAIARALITEPEVLLLDEPFSALDTIRKEKLELELLKLQESYKGTILFVTHDLSQGYKLGSKIAVFESGRIMQFGEKNDVINMPCNRTVAKLTGVKNLFEGTVITKKDDTVYVDVPELGGSLKVATNVNSLSSGQKITIGVRPEHVHLVNAPGENTFPLAVSQAVNGVATVNYSFSLNGSSTSRHHLDAVLSKSEVPLMACGQQCFLYLPPEHLAVITGN